METPIDRFLLRNGYKSSRALDDKREEGITKDYAFNKLSFDGGKVRNPADNAHIDVGVDDIQVKLVQGIDEAAFRSTLSMATKATLGVDLSQPQDEGDWEEMLQGGLQTALETQVIVFAVSGVSRACTHQLVRSRRAAFHQQSMRAHYYGERPEFRCPESVWAKGGPVLGRYIDAVYACHEAYVAACEAGVSYQDARYILPEGTTNFILLEYPVREFLNVYAYRACSMFQWEIVAVMREAKRVLVEQHPWIEPYVKISCEKTHGAKDIGPNSEQEFIKPGASAHTCTFQGWEQVEGQCDFPWARESNRTFRSERHEIKREDNGRKRSPKDWWEPFAAQAEASPGTPVSIDISCNSNWTNDKAGRNLASSFASEWRNGGTDGRHPGFDAVYIPDEQGPRVELVYNGSHNGMESHRTMRMPRKDEV